MMCPSSSNIQHTERTGKGKRGWCRDTPNISLGTGLGLAPLLLGDAMGGAQR